LRWRALSRMASNSLPRTAGAVVEQTAKSVEHQTRKVAETARDLKHSSARIETSADRTTVLAADRNILASERTYAAWVRTGLLSLAGGIGAQAVRDVPDWLVLANGTLLIAFSLFCFGAAVWRHFHPGPPPPTPSVKVMPCHAPNLPMSVMTRGRPNSAASCQDYPDLRPRISPPDLGNASHGLDRISSYCRKYYRGLSRALSGLFAEPFSRPAHSYLTSKGNSLLSGDNVSRCPGRSRRQEPVLEIFCGHWSAEMIALTFIAAHLMQN
jgi:putative membrane protein